MNDSALDPSDARDNQPQLQGDDASTTESATHDSLEPSDARGNDQAAAVEADTAASRQALKAEEPTPQKQSKVGSRDQEEDDDDEDEDEDEEDEEEEDSDEEDEEPRLKYARLTQHLGPVYRNGDATSSFLVASDKMIVGTHNGNIHVIQLPMFQSLRVYHAHSASVTSISTSPFPPPLPSEKPDVTPQRPTQPPSGRPDSQHSQGGASPSPAKRSREPMQIPKTPSNDIYVATSSMDGNVCVQSLIDLKDVQLRNFARPVQAVALSPDYKTDRTYLSGGLAGQLILTVGGGPGRSTSTTTGTAAATASGWLGSMGLTSGSGKDTILHSGEGTISNIKWSLSGKFVVWLNEHGIKIMRSKLHLDSIDTDDAWKRIGHIDRPQTEEWETMAGVWKGRVEWIDEQVVDSDEVEHPASAAGVLASPATTRLKEQASLTKKSIERLLVGWGGTIWIIHVHPGGIGTGRNVGEKIHGRAEIVKILRMDCIISGIALYTQSLLLVLAYCKAEDDDEEEEEQPRAKKHQSKLSTASAGSEPSGGIRRKQNNQPPELRLIDLNSQAEVDKDGLSVSRYERLTSGDYHLGVLPARNAASVVASSKGTLEALAGLGTDMWNAAINPKSLFSSGASVMSRDSDNDGTSSVKGSTAGTIRGGAKDKPQSDTVHPSLAKPGAKIFIHSPYDCILGTRRDLSDHLGWLLERQQYQKAWELLDQHPDIFVPPLEKPAEFNAPSTPSKQQRTTSDVFYDDESVAESTYKSMYSQVEKEKRRIGELWIQELIEEGNWAAAGKICGKVLTSPDRWEKWVWTFAGAEKFDDITDSIPSLFDPPLPAAIYEVVLGHYLQNNKPRFRELLDRWSTDLFDINTITTALENQLKYRDVREDSVEDGEKGRDWRIVMESLANLHEANGRHREALKCYIKLQDADSAFRLIRDSHLAEAVADDIPSFIGLRVAPDALTRMTEKDLEDATSEAITLLVDEAQHGLVRPEVVIEQLQARQLHLYTFFYLRALWRGEGIKEHAGENTDRLLMDSQLLVDDFADLAVHLFAMYDRTLLMDYLKTSTSYALEKAAQECEHFSYYDELVYLYSKTGQMKRALFLIIDRLQNVHKAIEFAKEQDDRDLWEDLLNYSMDKPRFIRGLLEQVGTAIDPITLVRRIPEGLEIEGLREGLAHMMKEHEIQHSISSGVARVLRSEVAAAQNELRAGQRRGIKFEVQTRSDESSHVNGGAAVDDEKSAAQPDHDHRPPQPGHCAKCHEPFTEFDTDTLLAFACGHVFHVRHLMEMLHKRRADAMIAELGSSSYEDEDDDEGSGGGGRYTVGMKVMRARLLRDKVRGGCPLCHVRET